MGGTRCAQQQQGLSRHSSAPGPCIETGHQAWAHMLATECCSPICVPVSLSLSAAPAVEKGHSHGPIWSSRRPCPPILPCLLPAHQSLSPPPPHIPAQLTTLLPAVCVAAAAPPALGGCSQPETQGTCRIQFHTQMWHYTKHPPILIGLLGNSLIVSLH